METATRIAYPHVTIDPAVSEGRPCIEDTGVKVTAIAAAHEDGHTAKALMEFFRRRTGETVESIRALSLAEVHSALAYYYDNLGDLEVVRAEDQRLSDVAAADKNAEILRRYLGPIVAKEAAPAKPTK